MPGSQHWQIVTQTCQTYCGSAPLQTLAGKWDKKYNSKKAPFTVIITIIIIRCTICTFLFLLFRLLPALSWPSPTQPSRASNWQPLHTPRLSVSSRCRKWSNSALALGLYKTVAAQPFMKDKWCYAKICISKWNLYLCVRVYLYTFSWTQHVCIAKPSDKHDRFERLQG